MATAQTTKVPPTIVQPGSDDVSHEKKLQGNLAQALNVPADQVIPVQNQTPQSNLESFVKKVDPDFDMANVQEDLAAHLPVKTSPVRVAPNTTPEKSGFLNILLGRLKKKNPDKDIQEEK